MVLLTLPVRELLEKKGLQVEEAHIEHLEGLLGYLELLRGDLKEAKIDDADISLRNIPGGDHLD